MTPIRLHEALRVEGTDRYEILCYLLFPAGKLEQCVAACRRRFSGSEFEVTGLLSEGWPQEIVLVETRLKEPGAIPAAILSCIHEAIRVEECRAALCMLDGGFFTYADIFSAELADQTYAFCSEPESGVLCISAAMRATVGWKSMIEVQRSVALPGT